MTGRLLDRFGAYRVIFTGLLIYFLISIGLLFIKLPLYILALRIMQGAACAFFRPVIHYILGLLADNNNRGKTFGLFDLSFYTSLAAAPVFAGGMKENYGFQGIFILTLICSSLALSLINTLRDDLALIKMSRCNDQKQKAHNNSSINSLYTYIFFKGWAITSVVILLPLYMHSIGMPETYIGVVLAVSTSTMALTIPFSGYLADKINKLILIFLGCTAYSCGIIVLFTVKDFSAFLFISALCGFAGGISQPACSALLIQSSAKDSLGSTIGRFNSMMGLGSSCGAIISSLMYYAHPESNYAIYLSGFLGIASIIIFYLISAEAISPYLKRINIFAWQQR